MELFYFNIAISVIRVIALCLIISLHKIILCVLRNNKKELHCVVVLEQDPFILA